MNPTQVKKPQLIGWSELLSNELQIAHPDFISDTEVASVLAGNLILPDMKPFAVRYGGHQFGHWAGQLGDGRAISLGEVNNYELQLKGAGRTPYSRQGDGRAVLRSSLREFICSEAMHALGVPTTRSLSLTLTGDQVMRDILYDGNPKYELGAVASRLSPSFIRFGNFEILSAHKQYVELKKLTDYVIQNFYPEILAEPKSDQQKYADFLKQVSIRTADMMTHWMSLGFVHGVMNTDNMSILGLTIDYGPYGWVEEFDPNFTPNTTDFSHRRYRFAHQPQIALWNLNCLANALYPLIEDKDLIVESLGYFQTHYEEAYLNKLSAKLGLKLERSQVDQEFLAELFDILAELKLDYTRFFRFISNESFDINLKEISYLNQFPDKARNRWDAWLLIYKNRRAISENVISTMKKNNPSIVFRNYLAQEAIDLIEKGDTSLVEKYLKEFSRPYEDRDMQNDHLTLKRPTWADNKPGCSILSCSS